MPKTMKGKASLEIEGRYVTDMKVRLDGKDIAKHLKSLSLKIDAEEAIPKATLCIPCIEGIALKLKECDVIAKFEEVKHAKEDK